MRLFVAAAEMQQRGPRFQVAVCDVVVAVLVIFATFAVAPRRGKVFLVKCVF